MNNITQEQILEQALNYIDYNLNDEKKLELVINILDNLSNYAFENGYNKKANTLTTTILILKEIGEKNEEKSEESIPLF